LEHISTLEFLPDPLGVLIDLEKAERISSMEAEWHHLRQVTQTFVLLGPLCFKFDLVKHCLEKFLVKSTDGGIHHYFVNFLFDRGRILLIDALDTHCEGALPRGEVITVPRAIIWG
jgi:hypothetical protein